MTLSEDTPAMAIDISSADTPGPGPISGKPAAFVFARDRGERARDINDFYNGFTGKARSLEAYQWEFYGVPSGPALVWTITEAATQRVVGHHSIIPTPLVRCGTTIPAGRTENTIIDPAVRTKLFYPGMEKKALAEARQSFGVLYTIHSTGPGRLRERFGYRPVGRWVVYLPKIGPKYLNALLQRGRDRVVPRVPDVLLTLLANAVGRVQMLGNGLRRAPHSADVVEIDDIGAIATEYEAFWSRARRRYDLTIDRSVDFLRWRIADNPHLKFRTWTLRRAGELQAVVIGHRHHIGAAAALYVDDVIVGDYVDASFETVLSCLPHLDPDADAVVVMTLALDTPLHRALRRRLPLQARFLDRYGHRLFDEMLALDSEGASGGGPWYVTPVFTEGMDTSR